MPIDHYGLRDESGWGRRLAHLTFWLVAGAISLLANAELFMLLAHRETDVAGTHPADPAVMMVELPAVDTTPAPRSDAAPVSPPESPPEPPHAAPAETAAREPDAPAPPDGPLPPDAVTPDDAPADAALAVQAQAPQPWASAPLPVPRPHRRRPEPARHAVVAPAARRFVHAAIAAARPAPAGARGREARRAAVSAFAGAASAADWKSQVVAALNRAKRYPDGSEAVGSPTLRMMVAASGDVARVAIVASSGSSVLDSAAIETVRRTSPLPPPPGGATGLTFRMNFHLRSP